MNAIDYNGVIKELALAEEELKAASLMNSVGEHGNTNRQRYLQAKKRVERLRGLMEPHPRLEESHRDLLAACKQLVYTFADISPQGTPYAAIELASEAIAKAENLEAS